MLCEPEVRQVTLPASGGRVIIASDGLWDAVAPKTAAHHVRGMPATKASRELGQVMITPVGVWPTIDIPTACKKLAKPLCTVDSAKDLFLDLIWSLASLLLLPLCLIRWQGFGILTGAPLWITSLQQDAFANLAVINQCFQ